MALIDVNHQPSATQLRLFAAGWLVIFAAWAAWAAAHDASGLELALLAASGLVLPLTGWAHRPFVRFAYVGLCYAALPVGYVVTYVFLAIFYFGVITPIGGLRRWIRPDPLGLRLANESTSYWTKRSAAREPSDYLRPF